MDNPQHLGINLIVSLSHCLIVSLPHCLIAFLPAPYPRRIITVS